MRTKSSLIVIAVLVVLSVVGLMAQQSGDQNTLNLSFVGRGASARGIKVLQTGDLSSLSSAVATATLTKAVTAPTTGSTYIRAVLVEKATATTGSFTIQTGTGTNCGTGTTVLLGPVVNMPVQQYYMGLQAPAGKDVCIQTDASTTSVRLMYL